MKIYPGIPCWIKFFAFCNRQVAYRFIASVTLLFAVLFSQNLSACVISCKSNLNVSLDASGQAVITPLILLQDPSCDPAEFTVDITDPQGNSIGNTLTCAYVGLTMTATVTHNSGNSCWTLINVEDHIKPLIHCADTTVLCIEPTSPADLGFPVVNENCTAFTQDDLMYEDELIDMACFATNGVDSVTSRIERTWTITDASGNVGTCLQTIYLKRATVNDVVFPDHRDGFEAPALDCNDDPEDYSLTGEPTINGKPIVNGGNCELVASKSDQIFELCSPSSYQILRTWTIIDYCSSDNISRVQVIKVLDTTAPVINCPADITVGTSSNSCDASVNLPPASGTDDCSSFTITPSWAFGNGHGPFFNVPVGVHNVTYTAEDECGNTSTCVMSVTIIDDVAPTTICDLSTEVNLTSFGTAIVFAETFDNGSHDNCGIDSLRVSRDGINFGNYVGFNCGDLEVASVPVTLRVWDTSGNYNECNVNVSVDDKINPAITCPSTVYVECDDDVNDLQITGQPLVDDNCTVDSIYYADVTDINSCGVGTISRTWTVQDQQGNISSCIQLIYVEDNTPLGISFPEDFVTYDCYSDLDPVITGEPTISSDNCESVSINHSDDIFNISPSCYTVLRNWTVVDWCTYVPNSGSTDGYYTYTQVIEVQDSVAPIINCIPDTIVGMYSPNCDGIYVGLPIPTTIDCNPEVNITNNSPFATAGNEDASGFYPPGNHTVTFQAEDGCGNTSSCQVQITVVDAKAPTVYCSGGVVVELDLQGNASITPDLIDNGSYDNCTADENLTLQVFPNQFTCADLGTQTVTLTVTDEEGNTDFCTTTIVVQDNNNVCEIPSAIIAGANLTESGAAIQQVDMILSGDFTDTISNDADGYFEFPEVPLGGNYTLTPYKNTKSKNGVSTFDVIFITRHILGIQPLSSPYKMIAADVNKSGSISAFDVVLLRKLILQIDTAFTQNNSWRFVDASYVFPNPGNPFSSAFPESLTYNDLSQDELSAEFIGIKIGDVNGNANPAELDSDSGTDRSSGESLVLKIPDRKLERGKDYSIPVKAADLKKVLGYQFTLKFDNQVLEFKGMETDFVENMSEENFGLTHLNKGMITTSWINLQETEIEDEAVLFVLNFKAKGSGFLQDLIEVNSQLTQAEAYNSEMEIIGIELEVEAEESLAAEVVEESYLWQNYPNPVVETTTIGFRIGEAEKCELSILDLNGRIIKVIEIQAVAGYQEVRLKRADFNSAGLYVYQLKTSNGETLTRKLVVE